MIVYFCFRFPVLLFGIPGISNCHATPCLLGPHLCFFILLKFDSFVYRDNSLTSKRVIMRSEKTTKCFVPLQKLRARLAQENLFKPLSYSLLTVPRRYFCYGTLFPAFGVRVTVTFHLMCLHIIVVPFGLLSIHLLGKSCSLG